MGGAPVLKNENQEDQSFSNPLKGEIFTRRLEKKS